MASSSKSSSDSVLAIRQHPQSSRESAPKKAHKKSAATQNIPIQHNSFGPRIREKKPKSKVDDQLTTKIPQHDISIGEMQVVKKKKTRKKKSATQGEISKKSSEWKLSQFVGGRYGRLDPVFSGGERHLFLTNANLLKVFSTKTSLLVRTITISSSSKYPEHIVGYALHPCDSNQIYIATPSRIFLWDWSSGEQMGKWNPQVGQLQRFCVSSDLDDENSGNVFLVAKGPQAAGCIVYSFTLEPGSEPKKAEIFKTEHPISGICVVDGGWVVCVISEKKILIANYDGSQWLAPRNFNMSQTLTCLDVYIQNGSKGKKSKFQRAGHVVVGDKSGVIYILHDVVLKPINEATSMKMHWHRRAVSSVKWALNGRYVVSGGLETVLVLWQLETGGKQFLPHLGAAIKNIVVSPGGASYAISLSDNSVITVSTTELKVTANIAGIQSRSQNRKVHNSLRVPCILHPTTSNNLLVVTPSDQLDRSASSPYLQTFDTYSDRHIARQALARTNATNANQGPDFNPISEPTIVCLSITRDGEWLASVDEWHPPPRTISGVGTVDAGQRREVFLRFWKWEGKRKEWDLVARVDTPHPSNIETGAEAVVDIATTLDGHEFATIGADGCARIWKPKDRKRAGAKTEGLMSWGCRQSIQFARQRHTHKKLAVPHVHEAQPPTKRRFWGNIAYSEDGSLLAVVSPECGFTGDDAVIQILSPDEGTVKQTLGGMNIGRSHGIAIIERYLIVACTRKLLVWNLVDGQVEWELVMADVADDVITSSIHLAADHQASTFALSVSTADAGFVKTLIHVFNPSSSILVHSQIIDASVAALKSVNGGKGYMILNCEARVQFLSPVNLGIAPNMATGPISAEEVESRLSELYLGNTAAAVVKDNTLIHATNEPEDVEMEDGSAPSAPIVPRQKLEEAFDEFLLYSGGSAEGVFDRVFDMFMKRPVGKGDNNEAESEPQDDVDEEGVNQDIQ